MAFGQIRKPLALIYAVTWEVNNYSLSSIYSLTLVNLSWLKITCDYLSSGNHKTAVEINVEPTVPSIISLSLSISS